MKERSTLRSDALQPVEATVACQTYCLSISHPLGETGFIFWLPLAYDIKSISHLFRKIDLLTQIQP